MVSKMFKQLCEECDFDLDEVDFLENATNVYRTNEFIVSQHISYISDGLGMARIMSEDTFYARTEERDFYYDELFDNDGKRIHSAMSSRTYIE